MTSKKLSPLHFALLVIVAAVFLWSVIHPHDRFTWWLEVFPIFIAAALLLSSYSKFRFTDLVYVVIALHCVILLIGGHYTYAEVPLFNDLRDEWGLSRNYYDRVGHVMQGITPALVGRELLLRTSTMKRGAWLAAVLILSCLGISALYELLEWQVAIFSGADATAFLATQGDVWDTQEDMACALVGAIMALLTLSRLQDAALRRKEL